MLMSKTGIDGAAIQSVAWNDAVITIAIPAGKGGKLVAVEFSYDAVRETVLCSGGVARLRNNSADWAPFYFITSIDTTVTEGGNHESHVVTYNVEKELPGNSEVYVDYRPNDNAAQILRVTLIWELGGKVSQETMSDGIFPLWTAVVTAAVRASPGNFQVPGGKGGRVFEILDVPLGSLETAVSGGGMRELFNDAFMMDPCETHTPATTTIGASGGGSMKPKVTPFDAPCPANSTFTTYYTPLNDQAQVLYTLVRWKRPLRRRIS